MATCVTCGSYYRLSPWHCDNRYCQECINEDNYLDDESKVEIELLLHPTGKKEPVYEAE